MPRKKKLLLTISNLQAGGAERVMTTLANYWAENGWEVTLVTYESPHTSSFYPLNPKLKVMRLDVLSLKTLGRIWDVFARVFKIRAALKREAPEVIVSFMDMNNVLTWIASIGLGMPLIASERINPKKSEISFLKKKLRDFTYRFVSKLVVQTKDIFNNLPASVERACIIPNPLSFRKRATDHKKKQVVAVGRLEYQKGFDVLIKVFSVIAKKHPDWTLVIWGEGTQRDSLQKLIHDEKLEGHVRLPGLTKDISKAMSEASVFVLSSRFEGMPNVLLEAMSLGMAVISTDCPTGPGEMIQSGKNGFLVPVDDEGAMVNALEKLIGSEELRKDLGDHAFLGTEQYDIKDVAKMWELLFDEVTA